MQKSNRKLKIGIIATESNKNDILFYEEALKQITTGELKEQVKLVIYGHNSEEDEEWLNDVDFQFVKPTSVVHYFKQLKALNLDVLLILLEHNVYNATSEDYNKFLEAALYNIPVLAPNLPAYNQIIRNGVNGFIYGNKEELVTSITELLDLKEELNVVGIYAHETMEKYFSFSEENTKLIDDLFV